MGMKIRHLVNAKRIVKAAEEPVFAAKSILNEIVSSTKIVTTTVEIVPDSARKYSKTCFYISGEKPEHVLDYLRDSRKDMRHIGILNFASFTTPGGGFLKGYMAQEENLCHHSFLYPVLENMDEEFYAWNRKDVNNHIYHDRCLYSPSVPFFFSDDEVIKALSKEDDKYENFLLFANVLSIAAPVNSEVLNKLSVNREKEVHAALERRIDLMLSTFMTMEDDIIILGPWGCGLFNNDPYRVVNIMMKLLFTKYEGVFKEIYFACPHENSTNYQVFEDMLSIE